MPNTIVSTQFLLPQSVISNGFVTGNPWTNPNNILLVDGDLAASNVNQTASDITVGNFLTNIPQNAVITGMELELIAKRGAQTSPVITLTPYFLDNTSGTDVYYPYVTPVTSLTPNLTTIILGSPTYLFASQFTPDQINNAKFNLVANGDVSIDSILLKVYYFIPSTPTPPAPTGNSCPDCNSPVQAQPFYLALPFKSGDRFAYLESFNYPDGTPIQYADLGACGGSIKLVFDPAVPKIGNSNFEENAETAVWTIEPNGTVKLDFGNINISRGLMFHTPYTADPLLRSDHDANSKVIISDSAPFLGMYLQKCQIDSVVSAPIIVENQDVPLPDPAHDLDFRGAGVVVANAVGDSHKKIITIPGAGGTTPPKVVSTTSATTGSTPTISLPADLNISGLNRGVAIQISGEQTKTIVSVTVGGVVAVQQIISTDAPHNLREEQWFCQNPPLGVQPVVVTWSAPTLFSFGAECLNGVSPTSPVGATQSASGSSFNPTLSITTTVDYSIILDGLGTAKTPILYTPGAGQASNWSRIANTDARQGGSSVESAGLQPDTITMDYGITQNTPWVYTAMEIVGITNVIPGVDEKVKVDGADTTPGFLDPKLSIISGNPNVSVVKTILNVGGNEVIQYAISSTGGAGSGGGSYLVDQTPDNGTYGLLSGNVDGINALYTVSAGKYISGTLVVFLNGLAQEQGASQNFVETTPNSGTFTFNTPPLTGDVITVVYQSSLITGANAIVVTQATHGFSVGQVVHNSGVANTYSLAQADVKANAEVTGYVDTVISPNIFVLVTEGFVTGGVSAQVPGTIMFLSDTVAGALTATEPTVAPTVSKPLMEIIANATLGYFHNYRGQENQTTPLGSSGLLHSYTTSTLTNPPNTTPIVLDSYTIPANTFSTGDVLRLTIGDSIMVNALNSGNLTIKIAGSVFNTYGSPAGFSRVYSTQINCVVTASTIETMETTLTSSAIGTYIINAGNSLAFNPAVNNLVEFIITDTGGLGGVSGMFNNITIEKV